VIARIDFLTEALTGSSGAHDQEIRHHIQAGARYWWRENRPAPSAGYMVQFYVVQSGRLGVHCPAPGAPLTWSEDVRRLLTCRDVGHTKPRRAIAAHRAYRRPGYSPGQKKALAIWRTIEMYDIAAETVAETVNSTRQQYLITARIVTLASSSPTKFQSS
jgi:hypothetical protein